MTEPDKQQCPYCNAPRWNEPGYGVLCHHKMSCPAPYRSQEIKRQQEWWADKGQYEGAYDD